MNFERSTTYVDWQMSKLQRDADLRWKLLLI